MNKARLENGRIRQYSKLPNSDGNIIGGFASLSDEKIKEHGFYDVVIPTYDNDTEYLGDLTFDSNNEIFTRNVIAKKWPKSLSEMKEDKINHLKLVYNSELSKTDWIIVRNIELGQTTDQSVLEARQTLRNEYAVKRDEINSKTTKKSVAKYRVQNFI